MSETDRVPSPAAPPAVAAAAPEERKGKEPEREKLPPIVSAGAGATAVGARRGPPGAPTAASGERSMGHAGDRPGRCAQAALPGDRGQPRTLGQLHLPLGKCWGGRVRWLFSVIFWFGGAPSFSKEMTSILESALSVG